MSLKVSVAPTVEPLTLAEDVIKRAYEIGLKGEGKHIYHACVDCGKKRWVRMKHDQPVNIRCRSCSQKQGRNFLSQQCGINHHAWKGGRYRHGDGYVCVRLYPVDFFYSMCGRGHYVLEHRLVMAKSLGRCLQPWEVVHHKNGRRDDNRIENLELAASHGEHSLEHSLGYKAGYEKGLRDGKDAQIEELHQEIKLLQWHVSEARKAGGI